MRSGKLVVGLGLGLLLLPACGASYGYYGRHRYYGGGVYASPGVVYTQPPPPQGQVVVEGQVGVPPPVQPQPVQPVMQPGQVTITGEGIAGSDGSRGWRVVSQAPEQDFQRLMQGVGRLRCQVEAATQVELRAVCNGSVRVMVRFDQQNIYKLCAPGTDPNACLQVWSAVGN